MPLLAYNALLMGKFETISLMVYKNASKSTKLELKWHDNNQSYEHTQNNLIFMH